MKRIKEERVKRGLNQMETTQIHYINDTLIADLIEWI